MILIYSDCPISYFLCFHRISITFVLQSVLRVRPVKLLGPVALPLDLELSSDMLRALGPINGSLDREKLRLVGATLYYTKRRLSSERVGLHTMYYIYILSILYLSYLYRFIYSYNYDHIYIHVYFHVYIHIYMRIYMRIFYIYVLYIYVCVCGSGCLGLLMSGWLKHHWQPTTSSPFRWQPSLPWSKEVYKNYCYQHFQAAWEQDQ